MPSIDPVEQIRELPKIREQSLKIFNAVKDGNGKHFDMDLAKLDGVAGFVAKLIKRDFPVLSKIPPHGRWQHLDAGKPRLDTLMLLWNCDTVDQREQARRMFDLFVISVLLDAGAGNQWKYRDPDTGNVYTRSEGIAVASFQMFTSGLFSSDQTKTLHQVDGPRLESLSAEELSRGLQVSESNPIADLHGRVKLLNRLGKALRTEPFFRPNERPGCIIDYCGMEQGASVSMPLFWRVIIHGFQDIWDRDKRIIFEAKNLGDAWPSDSIAQEPGKPLSNVVPFHKLSQWLTYSLMTPMWRVLGVSFRDAELLTGLPEYRNGGLFADLGVLKLKEHDVVRGLEAYAVHVQTDPQPGGEEEKVPLFQYNDPVTVEWRALTVILLDQLLDRVNAVLGEKLSLAQMLEAGSWKGGREIAAELRPKGRGPPIMVVGDGTLF